MYEIYPDFVSFRIDVFNTKERPHYVSAGEGVIYITDSAYHHGMTKFIGILFHEMFHAFQYPCSGIYQNLINERGLLSGNK